jgi:hypothetical protein
MILIYSSPSNRKQIDNTIEMLKDKLSLFSIGDFNDFIYTTETNDKLLRDIIPNYNISLFYTINPINEMGFSLTELISFIIYLLKNNCNFQSVSDDLYLSIDNIDNVVITITDIITSNHNE